MPIPRGTAIAATGEIRTSMLIAAALIEGVGFAGIVVAFLLAGKT